MQRDEEKITYGWMADQDRMHPPGQHTIGPWEWAIMDHSAAILCAEGDPIIGSVMVATPCESCANRAEPKEWKWGRCGTPTIENARVIAAAPEMLTALKRIVHDSMFKDHPEASQMAIDAISKAEPFEGRDAA